MYSLFVVFESYFIFIFFTFLKYIANIFQL